MSNVTISINEEHSHHFGQLYQQYEKPLRDNFRSLLGNAAEADECVWDTFGGFFSYMENRPWEPDEELINYRLRMIGAGLCTRKLAEKCVRLANGGSCHENASLLDKIRSEVLRPVLAGMEFKQLFLRMFGIFRQPGLKHLSTAFR